MKTNLKKNNRKMLVLFLMLLGTCKTTFFTSLSVVKHCVKTKCLRNENLLSKYISAATAFPKIVTYRLLLNVLK